MAVDGNAQQSVSDGVNPPGGAQSRINLDSSKACPTCGKDVGVAQGQGPRDCDVDHQPPRSTRDTSGVTRGEVIDEYNKDTRLECPSCNRSRGNRPAGQ
ncbi:GH-E family nuclease [Paraburkholderia xenovorans]|uniref:GH-E family nuclease n=1 Tax=Paraburkholderia xenovorans TaxID=36873 RepID=UPI0038BAA198